MSKYIIQGKSKLSGEIAVQGAKNAALKIIPAALLSDERMTIENLPEIEDIKRSLELAADIGLEVKHDGATCELEVKDLKSTELNPDLANKFRTSMMFVGPLLARLGEVKFPHPGGCVIGAGTRPIDLFLEGFAHLGAEVIESGNFYHIKAKKLKGCEYFFTKVSVTGTESLMMTAVLAEGTTVLKNCAMEPEIPALADYLNEQGAKITGAGTPTITIEGVKKISAGTFKVIPDRIETGTYAIMAAATRSALKITECDPTHIQSLLNVFSKIGIEYEAGDDWLEIKAVKDFEPYGIKTHEYPGFPTDLQSPYTVLMTRANGSCVIHETIYERRLGWSDMLVQMGANIIMCDPHRVVVNGPSKLYGRKLISPDIRAGIAMVIAAMIARGETEIDNIYQIERGYSNLVERLRGIGVEIERVE